MRRREFITVLGGAAAAWPVAARAQRGAAKRIGVLMPETEGSADTNAQVVVFENTLKQLGWVPGRNLQIDYRWAMGDLQRMRLLAADLVNLTPDALVAASTPSLAAIQKATHTIPIVFVAVTEPVLNGFVPSLAHPGGNATGFSNLEPSIGEKWLEILKGIAPRTSRVAVMFNLATGVTTDLFFRAIEAVGPRFAVETVMSDVHSLEEIEAAMKNLGSKGTAGLILPPEPFTLQNSKPIVELASQYRLPAVYSFPSFCAAGGLASYGVHLPGMFRPAAEYIDRILKGEQPGDLPVQQPTTFQFVINLKTAKALGLTIPPSLLATADEVIQ
ncbi:MAG: ABC transporter substrate-binding protein [Xanthobacteraceae bacterium]|nr:ABC transporter substrate-binding protein [Xanthobacteraceae bacterium]